VKKKRDNGKAPNEAHDPVRNYIREIQFMAKHIALPPQATTREALLEAWREAGGPEIPPESAFDDVLDPTEGGAA
jgi:hypothetical protein